MRILVGLIAFQSALILLLTAKMFSIESAVTASNASSATLEKPPTQDYRTLPATAAPTMTPDEIRTIIREEIAALSRAPREATPVSPARDDTPSTSPQHAALRDTINRDIDGLIAGGRITPAQMADLQKQMVSLDQAERQTILNRITKAMNNGQLEGEF